MAERSGIRTLGPDDSDHYIDHLTRLDPEARRMRFFADLPEFHLALHAGGALSDGRFNVAFFEDGMIRGAAELLPDDQKPGEAEAAFSVESGWRGRGIGKSLMAEIIAEARRGGIEHIKVACLPENAAMRKLAACFTNDLRREGDNILGLIRH